MYYFVSFFSSSLEDFAHVLDIDSDHFLFAFKWFSNKSWQHVLLYQITKKTFDGIFRNFQLWVERFMNVLVIQSLHLESAKLEPPNQKYWQVSAKPHVQFL